jgi:hypothetical protein
MKLLKESLLVLALGLSLSSATPTAGPSVLVKAGSYPWNVWKGPLYNEAYPGIEGYERFKKEVAVLNPNDLPDSSERSFRKIGKRVRLTYPALPGTTASASDIAKAKADQKSVDDSVHAAEKAIWESKMRDLQKAYDLAAGSMYKNLAFWFVVIAALLIGGGLAYVITRRHYEAEPDPVELRKLSAENTHLRHELRNRDAQDHFLKLYTHAFEVPEDIGKVFGKTKYIYLLKAHPIDGEEAVFIHGHDLPIKVGNVKRYLYDASRNKPEVLRYYHISRKTVEEEVGDTEPTRAL